MADPPLLHRGLADEFSITAGGHHLLRDVFYGFGRIALAAKLDADEGRALEELQFLVFEVVPTRDVAQAGESVLRLARAEACGHDFSSIQPGKRGVRPPD